MVWRVRGVCVFSLPGLRGIPIAFGGSEPANPPAPVPLFVVLVGLVVGIPILPHKLIFDGGSVWTAQLIRFCWIGGLEVGEAVPFQVSCVLWF